ncbi:putative transformation/transcription domain-associated protein [Balamuthia mandrillaris]
MATTPVGAGAVVSAGGGGNGAPRPTTNVEDLARRFMAAREDAATQLQIVTEIRDNVEIVHTGEYPNFLKYLFPIFYNLLRQGQPELGDGPEQKTRNTVLDILNRLPNNEHLKPYAHNLLKLSMYLLEVENEENAVICLRIIIDLHKNYRPMLEEEVQPFLDIVQKIYSELPKTVRLTFQGSGSSTSPSAAGDKAAGSPSSSQQRAATQQQQQGGAMPLNIDTQKKPTTLIRSTQSFKVLTECPIIVVLLFQLYPRFLQTNIPKFMPLIVNTLTLTAPPSALTVHRASYVDFIAAQVKTLSFLAYMLRSFAEHLKPYQESIPSCVINLLLNCPNECAAIRKELLIATRHILATDFRLGFISKIDTLLNEEVLIGNGRTSYETLRPLAYSTLADLVHHVRTNLSLEQLTRVVYLFSRNIHDPSLPFNIQTMSAKLLLNLVECIARKNTAESSHGRTLLVRILDNFVNKFSSLKKQIPKIVSQKPESIITAEEESASAHKKRRAQARALSNVKDCRLLMKTLVLGLKNIVWGISSCSPAFRLMTGGREDLQRAVALEESLIFTRLLKNGLKCFSIYSEGPNPSPQEEKDILDHFAAVFTMVDGSMFRDVFNTQMPFLFQQMMSNQAVLTIPQHFLANPNVSRVFAEILLNFLMKRLSELAGADASASAVLLRLFKLVFGSVTLFSDNEPVLQPHLANIITSSMKYASEVNDPNNYFQLLRALFRSIGGGKFEHLYKEFLPLLPALLDILNRLQASSHPQSLRDLFVELCLTVPVRLSSLLPCLRLLMRPLVLALESKNNDLVTQGLRTMELCVDNLTPDFRDPILAEVQTELMLALWRHIQYPPTAHTIQAVRILGKLAGRNRRFLKYAMPPSLEYDRNAHSFLNVVLEFEPGIPVTIPLGRFVFSCRDILASTSSSQEVKREAFTLLQGCLTLMINASCIPDNERLAMSPSEMHIEDGMVGSKLERHYPLFIEYADEATPTIKTRTHLKHETELLKTLISAVVTSSSDPQIKDFVIPFAKNLTRHFAILYAVGKQPLPTRLEEFDPKIFITALLEGITSTEKLLSKAFLWTLDTLICYVFAIKGKMAGAELPVFSEMAMRISHCCYKTDWQYKSGGCAGISLLSKRFPVRWVRQYEVQFVKALLFILKDLSPEVSASTVEEASLTLSLVLKVCNSKILSLLVSELSQPNATVRKNIKTLLQQLAEFTETEISTMLEPFKVPLLSPIFAKSLQNLPILVQTGYLDALTFYLGLRPPLLSFTPELLRVLREALVIAEADDLYKLRQPRKLQLLNNSKVVAIELMSVAMACPEFQGPEHQEFRNSIISVFFKTLTLRSKEVVAVSKKGLSHVIVQHKLPKELLQSSLRPVLLNLADHRKLSVPLLKGLARLLELLTNCFNVTLGEKLLEHLHKWTEPAKLAAAKIWKEGEEIKIAARIIDIFHLLPSAASKFLDQLVTLTIQLEALLPREITSPYREPLIKFLNRYPAEALEYFLSRLSTPQYSKLFTFLINHTLAGPLRTELSKNPDKLIKSTFQNTQTQSPDLQFQGILLVRTLVKFLPDWLGQNRPVLDCLLEIWKSPAHMARLKSEETLHLQHLRESKLLIKCFLNYCKQHTDEVDTLFHMLSIFTIRTTMDYSFLHDFYMHDVAEGFTITQKKAILNRFVELFRDPKDTTFTQEHKVKILQVLIIPLLTASFLKQESNEIVDQAIIASIVSNILDPNSSAKGGGDKAVPPRPDEALSIELLQLATLLVRFMPNELVEHRKELIKFAWNHLKSEDTTSKQCAYVLVCRFIEAYETPHKIILQVYVALLRAFQPEARSLVRQALDILTPALEKRLPSSNPWIKWTKKILVEEGHTTPQLIHILQLLSRHPTLFYKSRGQFVPHIVHSLARIGLLPNASIENKRLAIDLVDLILIWERRRQQSEGSSGSGQSQEASDQSEANKHSAEMSTIESKEKTEEQQSGQSDGMEIVREKIQEDTPSPSGANGPQAKPQKTPAAEGQDFKPNTATMEMVVNFLIRSASTGSDARDQGLALRALELLKHALLLWPDINIKFTFFEKLVAAPDPHVVVTGLSILNVITEHQTQKFVLSNAARLQCLLPLFSSIDQKIVASLCKLLGKIFKTFPIDNPPTELLPFYTSISEIVGSTLLADDKRERWYGTVLILKIISATSAAYLDRFLPQLAKLLQRLVKEQVSSIPPSQAGAPVGLGPVDPSAGLDPRSQSSLFTIKLCVHLIGLRAGKLSSSDKKAFLSTLYLILEKLNDVQLLRSVLKMVTTWIRKGAPEPQSSTPYVSPMLSPVLPPSATITSSPAPTVTPPSTKKTNLLLRMIRFANMEDKELQNGFLYLVYHVYSNLDSSHRTDQAKLEPAFMAGLRCNDPTVRATFYGIYHKRIGKSLWQRLNHIITNQNWEPLADGYWIKQALELLMGVINAKEPLHQTPHSARLPPLGDQPFVSSLSATMDVDEDNEPATDKGLSSPLHISSNDEDKDGMEEEDHMEIEDMHQSDHGNVSVNQDDDMQKEDEEERGDGVGGRNSKGKEKEHSSEQNRNSVSQKESENDKDKTMADKSKEKQRGNDEIKKKEASSATKEDEMMPDEPVITEESKESLLQQHEQFLSVAQSYRTRDLLQPLSKLIHWKDDMAFHVWTILFPALWSQLGKDEQAQLVTPLVSLLSKDYHAQQKLMQPNVVQTLLTALSACNPMPDIPVKLIKYLGKSFNVWHVATLMLESKVNTLMVHNSLPTRMSLMRPLSNDRVEEMMEEEQAEDGPSATSGDRRDGEKEEDRAYEALAELYQLLSEEDLYAGLMIKRACTPLTRAGIVAEQHGLWQKSQDLFFYAMETSQQQTHNPTSSAAMTTAGGSNQQLTTSPSSRSELALWEDHWVHCAKHLNQWDTLNEFARAQNHTELLLESAWKVEDWNAMKECLVKYCSPNNMMLPDSPQLKLYQSYMAVHEAKPQDVEGLCAIAIQLCLRQWQGLPAMTPLLAHVPLLQSFQQIVELRESAQVIREINANNRHQAIPEIKNILNTWRERLPNKWEDIIVWNDLLSWRQHVFTLINAAFQPLVEVNSAVAYIGHHEIAWTINTFSHVARKHGLVDVCLNSLSKIYSLPNIEIQDAFVKLREQVKCYFQLPTLYRTGLDIINSTNLDYFGPQQKAEFFQLKGEFLDRMAYHEDANMAFSTAVSIFDGLAHGWISWGRFADRQFLEYMTPSNKDDKEAANKRLMWAEYSLNCYLQAIRSNTSNAKKLISRVLWLLHFDDPATARLAKSLEIYGENLPIWIWIPWIPQLFSSLSRPTEAPQMKNIILKIATLYPQSIYYPLRTFLLRQRPTRTIIPTPSTTAPTNGSVALKQEEGSAMQLESSSAPSATPSAAPPSPAIPSTPAAVSGTNAAASSATSSTTARGTGAAAQSSSSTSMPSPVGVTNAAATTNSTNGNNNANTNVDTIPKLTTTTTPTPLAYAEEIMKLMKASYPAVVAKMEEMVKEIIRCVTTSPEEKLFEVCSELLQLCFKFPACIGADMSEVNQALHRTKDIEFETSSSTPSQYVKSMQEYKKAFLDDFFDDEHQVKSLGLVEIVNKLKRWRQLLRTKIDAMPSTLELEQLSRYLVGFKSNTIEVPGQYFENKEPATDNHVRIDGFQSEVKVLRKSKFSHRSITLRGSNGKEYPFHFQCRPSPKPKAEERTVQLLRLLNGMFDKHIQTRRRHVHFNIPPVVSFSPGVRLMQVDEDYVSLQDVYEDDCHQCGREEDAHMAPFFAISKQNQRSEDDHEESTSASSLVDVDNDVLLGAHNQVSTNLISDFVLTRFISKMLDSQMHLFLFKKQFCSELALVSLVGHVLHIGKRTPANIYFCKSTGRLLHLEYHPELNERTGRLESKETVPFRLTRNLQNFLNPVWTEGPYNGVMTAVATCLQDSKRQLQNHLHIFMRDELSAWSKMMMIRLLSSSSVSSSSSSSSMSYVEEQQQRAEALRERVEANTAAVLQRIDYIAPSRKDREKEYPPGASPINEKISQLIKDATSPHNLCRMDPAWLPSF